MCIRDRSYTWCTPWETSATRSVRRTMTDCETQWHKVSPIIIVVIVVATVVVVVIVGAVADDVIRLLRRQDICPWCDWCRIFGFSSENGRLKFAQVDAQTNSTCSEADSGAMGTSRKRMQLIDFASVKMWRKKFPITSLPEYTMGFVRHYSWSVTRQTQNPDGMWKASTFGTRQNYRDLTSKKVVSGQLPKWLVIGLVSNATLKGSKTHNPFNFQHYILTEIAIYLAQHMLKPIQPNSKTFCIRDYNSLLSGTGKLNRGRGHRHLARRIQNGYALYAFDLTVDLGEDDHFNLVRHGNPRLSLKFGVQLPKTMTVLVCILFDNVIELDRDRNVLVDFCKRYNGRWARFAMCCASSRSPTTFTALTLYRCVRTDYSCALGIPLTTPIVTEWQSTGITSIQSEKLHKCRT